MWVSLHAAAIMSNVQRKRLGVRKKYVKPISQKPRATSGTPSRVHSNHKIPRNPQNSDTNNTVYI